MNARSWSCRVTSHGTNRALPGSGGRDARGDGLHQLLLEPAEHHVGARFGENLDAAFADALGPTRDRDRPSGKSHVPPELSGRPAGRSGPGPLSRPSVR